MTAPTPRILIVRLSAIGDVVHGLPVLCALRDALPAAHLAWIVEERVAELLTGHPALDELIPIRRRWLKSPRAVREVWQRVRGRFDITIDVQGLMKSAVAARISGARRRIGFAPPQGREISPWLNNLLVYPTTAHVVDRNLELLAPLGIQPRAVRFGLPERLEDGRWAEQATKQSIGGARYALINAGAGWPSRLWPTDRYAAVAAHLGRVHGIPSLVVRNTPAVDEIVAGSQGWAHLAPPTTLSQLAALARRACLAIGADTGPLHLAAAVGTPCVGLCGPLPAERNGPYGAEHIAVQAVRVERSSRARRTANNDTMLAITAESVETACDTILSRRTDRSSA